MTDIILANEQAQDIAEPEPMFWGQEGQEEKNDRTVKSKIT